MTQAKYIREDGSFVLLHGFRFNDDGVLEKQEEDRYIPVEIYRVNHKKHFIYKGHLYSLERAVASSFDLEHYSRRNRYIRDGKWVNSPQMQPKKTTGSIRQRRLGKKHSDDAKERIGRAKRRAVIQKDIDGTEIATFDSIKNASLKTGVSPSSICSVCQGKRKTAGRFKWEYEQV